MPNVLDPASTEIARLVRAAQRGDHAAFTQLYRQFSRMVHGIALARVDRADVDDVVQDVFVMAFERLTDLREPAAFGGWLATMARRRAIDERRRVPHMEPLVDDVMAPAEADRTTSLAVLKAIRSLPDAYRETLILRLVEGMTGAEIAARTGLTPGSVRVNLHRGMSLLREKLT